jgi:hypothetical protein
LKVKKEVVKRWKKKAVKKTKGKEMQEQSRVWEFDTFIRERLKSVGIIE